MSKKDEIISKRFAKNGIVRDKTDLGVKKDPKHKVEGHYTSIHPNYTRDKMASYKGQSAPYHASTIPVVSVGGGNKGAGTMVLSPEANPRSSIAEHKAAQQNAQSSVHAANAGSHGAHEGVSGHGGSDEYNRDDKGKFAPK